MKMLGTLCRQLAVVPKEKKDVIANDSAGMYGGRWGYENSGFRAGRGNSRNVGKAARTPIVLWSADCRLKGTEISLW